MNTNGDRKLEVFIGATRQDLRDARNKVQEAVLEAGHFPSGMELWNSDTTPVIDTILRRLERCDVVILLVGARYGEFIAGNAPIMREVQESADHRKLGSPADSGISFTEWEFRKARKLNKPVIVFMMEEECYKTARKKELKKDPGEDERDDEFQRFRKDLRKSQFSREFTDTKEGIEQLGRHCVNALIYLQDTSSPTNLGWIRMESEDALIAQAIRDNPFLSRVIERLRQFQKPTERVKQRPKEKQVAADFFWEEMEGPIRRGGYSSLFFESGSSVSFVAKGFEEKITRKEAGAGDWEAWTNNVEILLQMLLFADHPVHRFPQAAPDPQDKYGAIFPLEFRLLGESAPKRPRPLYTRADSASGKTISEFDAVRRLQKELIGLPDSGIGSSPNRKLLVLATASGFDFTQNEILFRGPHVGSHDNMLFKRAILAAGKPVVLFLDSRKLGLPFKVGECFPIFDKACNWADAIERYPIAICAAWEASETFPGETVARSAKRFANRIASDQLALEKLGFETAYARRSGPRQHVVIAANAAFKKLFPLD